MVCSRVLFATVCALLASAVLAHQYDRGVVDGDTYVCADPINCCISAIRCLRMMLFAADDPTDRATYHESYLGVIRYSYLNDLGEYAQVFASDSNEADCPYPRCQSGFQPGLAESHTGDHADLHGTESTDPYNTTNGEGCWRFSPFTVGPDYHPQFHSLTQCLSTTDAVGDYYWYTEENSPPRAQHMMRHCTGPFLEAHRKCITAWIDSQFLAKVGFSAPNAYGTYDWSDVNSDALPNG